VVVGDGIAARCLLWHIASDEEYCKSKKILHIASDDFYPACTKRTTSVVSYGSHQKGISELGDLLVDSLEAFDQFISINSPDGITLSSQFYLFPKSEEKIEQFKSRYNDFSIFEGNQCAVGPCAIINSKELNEWFKKGFSEKFKHYTNLEDIVVNLDKLSSSLNTRENGTILFRKAIVCTGAYTSLLHQDRILADGKAVSGSYFEWRDIELNRDSFVLSQGHFNIIYRAHEKLMLFGGTSFDGMVFDHYKKELRDNYLAMSSYLPGLDLPDIQQAKVLTGIRHKGKKRMPQFINEGNILFFNGLYKNGFSFPFFFAKKLLLQNGEDLANLKVHF